MYYVLVSFGDLNAAAAADRDRSWYAPPDQEWLYFIALFCTTTVWIQSWEKNIQIYSHPTI